MFFFVLIKNTIVIIADATSAIGNANHTKFTFPSCASKKAAGSKTTNCLQIELTILYTALPNAWNIVPVTIQNAATGK